MTTEEIKEQVTMPEVMRRYGIQIRGNMCRCPFHGRDRHPSMKVFSDGAVCFTCNWSGDVFRFVMDYTHCSFKDAYLELGGEYEKHSEASKKLLELKRRQKLAEIEKKNAERQQYLQLLIYCINILKAVSKIYEPQSPEEDFSSEWTEAQNQLPVLWELWEEYAERGEYNLGEITRRYTSIRQQFID